MRLNQISADQVSRPGELVDLHRNLFAAMIYAVVCGPGSVQRPELLPAIFEAYERAASQAVAQSQVVWDPSRSSLDQDELDVGPPLLRSVFDRFQIEPEWALHDARILNWWGWRLAQNIEASEPWDDDDLNVCRIDSTVVIAEVVARTSELDEAITLVNQFPIGGAVFLDSQNRIVQHLSVQAHNENSWIETILSVSCMEQIDLAELRAEWLAEVGEGKVALTEHPISGERIDPDTLLTAGMREAGFDSTRDERPDIDDPEELIERVAEVVVELPLVKEADFKGTSLMIRMSDEFRPGLLALDYIADLSVPEHGDATLFEGPALRFTLELQGPGPAPANELNQLESVEPLTVHNLGAWSDSPGSMTYTMVLPALSVLGARSTPDVVGVIVNLLISLLARWRLAS